MLSSSKVKFRKFTPLTSKQIIEIINDADPRIIADIANKVGDLSKKYSDLIQGYQEARDKREFIEENMLGIAIFLNDCGLIGYDLETTKDPVKLTNSSYLIGAQGLSLISSYLKNKNKSPIDHDVEVVKNTTFIAPSGSMKHADIFIESNQVHNDLYKAITRDLGAASEREFNKTYLFEAFGTTGGDHFAVLTIHKRLGEVNPVVFLFDPSPAIVRNGLEAAQNSIANGWCSQLIINATAKKALSDCGLVFEEGKFYNNSEPLQQPRLSICTTFAYETAHQIARTNSEEHRKKLEEIYTYKSPYGGKTEMDLSDIDSGYTMGEPRLPAEDIYMSHFVDTALRPRTAELEKLLHPKKDETFESGLERIMRYQLANGYNEIAEQKTMRHKFGHLFEIAISRELMERVNPYLEVDPESPHRITLRKKTPYFPPYLEEPVKEILPLVKNLEEILPMTTGINRVDYIAEAETYKLLLYAGQITGGKIIDFATTNGLGVEFEEVNLEESCVGVMPSLSRYNKITLNIPRSKIPDIIEAAKARGVFFTSEKDPSKHPFRAQGATAFLSKEPPHL